MSGDLNVGVPALLEQIKASAKNYGKKLTAWLTAAGFSIAIWSTLAYIIKIIT